ncbi:class I SAM-dependent methyltransferase [Nocardia pseudobrasiliensis]|uniref:Methyltransferase family protein n=1 Tax=Nocardia pseudobrasiliensis TaxID=45979 RepID=A0A370IEE1_9NOCA|nr:class I SAM-dependent methyltransferase [Nocardia pseudobrasiliensis]RDI69096.1 methyltransferase family protein [Nocardia pseudobrasiliensis]
MTAHIGVSQVEIWDEWHSERDIRDRTRTQAELASRLSRSIGSFDGKAILDVGCGQGIDSIWFANMGANVCAFDLSTVAIDKAKRNAAAAGTQVKFSHFDIRNGKLPTFETNGFDGIFCNLSLHYFTDQITRILFSEIYLATKPGGAFAFTVKSDKDPYFGLGDKVADRMYERKGHIRHFFTVDYAYELLRDWSILGIDETIDTYQSDAPSAIISAVAVKRARKKIL